MSSNLSNHPGPKATGTPRAERRQHERTVRHDLKAGLRGAWAPFEARDVPPNLSLNGCISAHVNNLYSVQVYETRSDWGVILHAGIKRNDGAPVHNWAHFQRIKDEIFGFDRTAIEVYPAQDNLVDDAHMYWLWVLPVGVTLPFGLHLP